MARTIQQIFDEQKAEAIRLATEQNNTEALAMFNDTSKIALWRLLFYAMSFCVWSLENIFDLFTDLVNSIIATLTPHSLRWYRTKALAFQYGYDLIADSDKYDNTLLTADQIELSMVVKYAAVNEAQVDGRRVLLVKVAGVDGSGNLIQLPAEQEAAFIAYMERVKDAGNLLIIYNRLADILKTEVDVYYNPLLLTADGIRLDGLDGKPLEDAAVNYLLNLPFNGEFSNAAFIDTLQNAFGVDNKNVFLKSMQRKINDTDYQSVGNTFIPDAGYTKFDVGGLLINYIAHV